MAITTPHDPMHWQVYACFTAEVGEKAIEQCVCGLERLRDEHAAMRELLTTIYDKSLEPQYWRSAITALIDGVQK